VREAVVHPRIFPVNDLKSIQTHKPHPFVTVLSRISLNLWTKLKRGFPLSDVSDLLEEKERSRALFYTLFETKKNMCMGDPLAFNPANAIGCLLSTDIERCAFRPDAPPTKYKSPLGALTNGPLPNIPVFALNKKKKKML